MADIKTSALAELTAPADGDMFSVDDISEVVTEKTKRILFSTLRKAALADADGDTKITTDAAADEDTIRFYTGSGGQQMALADGALTPTVDNDVDIGSASYRFKIAAFVKYFMTSTFYATLPTNGVAADAVIMTGNASTIAWFYNNAAPPGWKVFGVADYVLRTGATGGITGGSWTISGLEHTHPIPKDGWGESGTAAGRLAVGRTDTLYSVTAANDLSTGSGGSSNGAWRPLGYIGKLYQLDTA